MEWEINREEIDKVEALLFSSDSANQKVAINILWGVNKLPIPLKISLILAYYLEPDTEDLGGNELAQLLGELMSNKFEEKELKTLIKNLSIFLLTLIRSLFDSEFKNPIIEIPSIEDSIAFYHKNEANITDFMESDSSYTGIFLIVALHLTVHTKIDAEKILPFYNIILKFNSEDPHTLMAIA